MYSLIIAVVSIALIAAVSVATVYYGGPALSKGTAKASAATIVTQGQQISGAATLFASDGRGNVTALTDLVDQDYLSSIPVPPAAVGGTWGIGTDDNTLVLTSSGNINDICLAIEQNRDSTVDEVPAASKGGLFGCYNADDSYNIYYSL